MKKIIKLYLSVTHRRLSLLFKQEEICFCEAFHYWALWVRFVSPTKKTKTPAPQFFSLYVQVLQICAGYRGVFLSSLPKLRLTHGGGISNLNNWYPAQHLWKYRKLTLSGWSDLIICPGLHQETRGISSCQLCQHVLQRDNCNLWHSYLSCKTHSCSIKPLIPAINLMKFQRLWLLILLVVSWW